MFTASLHRLGSLASRHSRNSIRRAPAVPASSVRCLSTSATFDLTGSFEVREHTRTRCLPACLPAFGCFLPALRTARGLFLSGSVSFRSLNPCLAMALSFPLFRSTTCQMDRNNRSNAPRRIYSACLNSCTRCGAWKSYVLEYHRQSVAGQRVCPRTKPIPGKLSGQPNRRAFLSHTPVHRRIAQ